MSFLAGHSDPAGGAPAAGAGAAPAAGAGAAGRQALFAKLREKKQQRLGAEQAIERRGAVTAEVSFGQRRLWFLEQFEPGNPRFNMLTALRLRGRLVPAALAGSVSALVARHEALRTTFVTDQGRPLQVVAPPAPVAAPIVDLAALAAAARDRLLDPLFRDEVRRPFDLARGPLLRVCLLRLAAEEHILLLAMHQITVDRWSRGLSVGELTELYRAQVSGARPVLAELSIQYADYAHWQRQQLSGDTLAALLAYWRERLGGELPVLALPCDRPRPAVQTFRGGNLYSALPPATGERLAECARRGHATLFMVLLGGFAALLARLTGAEDVVLGSPVANRRHGQLAPLIGFFLNLVVLRVDLSGNPTFGDVLDRVREVTLGAFAHQDLPFEQLVEHLAPERDLSRHPLFQTALVLQNAPMPAIELPGLSASLVEVDWGTATYDLSLFFWETALWEHLAAGLSLIANYNADLFDAATVRRLTAQLTRLLDDGAAHPERRLADLALLDAAERHQLLVEWPPGLPAATADPFVATRAAAAGAAPPAGVTIHRRLALVAAAQADRIAVEHAGECLSYGELERRAGRLARRLPRPAPAVMAVCLAPSLHLAVAAVAVLKTGAAYLPLDPGQPPARLAAVLRAAGAGCLVTRAACLALLPAPLPPTLCVDRPPAPSRDAAEPAVAAEPAAAAATGEPAAIADAEVPAAIADAEVPPQALAYVVHTSGSTGAPKLVGVPHAAVIERFVAGPAVELGPDDRLAQLASPAFDAFAFELWGALLRGARSIVLDRDAVLSAAGFQAAVERLQIGTVFLNTALFSRLAAVAPRVFAGLRQVLFGGEAADAARVRAVVAAGPPARLLHLYGPTEATVFAACHQVHAVPAAADTVPVGRPLAGTRLAVLDRWLAPAGIGVEGDLYLSGAGLARGYLGSPAATAAAFLPDPAGGAGQRRYQTGDRARLRADGTVEIRGRRDRQVKIRGYRVEPAEVEAALLRHPALAEAAVAVRTAPAEERAAPGAGATPHAAVPAGERTLVAAVVPHAAAAVPAEREVLAFLRRQLPGYMVPAAVVVLPALPRTASGKLDRAALAAQLAAAAPPPRPPGDAGFLPPATAEEIALAAIWAEVLGRAAAIGADDDFFALGGHSLHVVEVLAQVQRASGARLAVRELYAAPTLAGLAVVLAAATAHRTLDPTPERGARP